MQVSAPNTVSAAGGGPFVTAWAMKDSGALLDVLFRLQTPTRVDLDLLTALVGRVFPSNGLAVPITLGTWPGDSEG